jgi:site-specific recombinase XerD
MLHFEEKGGESREISVRHDLEHMIFEYLDAAGIRNAPKDDPLFRTALRKTGRLTDRGMHVVDVCRMVKRRLRDAGLAGVLSPHSFRVTTITDLLEQGVPLEDVQRLAGHATRAPRGSTTGGRKRSRAASSSGFRFETEICNSRRLDLIGAGGRLESYRL